MSFSAASQTSRAEAGAPHRCSRCGAEPRLVHTVLDSSKGRSIRMFKCGCGEQTWVSERA